MEYFKFDSEVTETFYEKSAKTTTRIMLSKNDLFVSIESYKGLSIIPTSQPCTEVEYKEFLKRAFYCLIDVHEPTLQELINKLYFQITPLKS